MDSSSRTSQAHFSMSSRMPVIKTQETANRCIPRFISESDVTTEYVTFRFVTRVTEKPVEPQDYIRNHSRHKRHHMLSTRNNTIFHICHQHYKSSAYPETLPRAGHYDIEAGVTRQDVSCRRWAANNLVTSLTSSNSKLALVSTHQLSLIQYFLSHCISKISSSIFPFSSFLVVSVRALVWAMGSLQFFWSTLYIYCL